MSIGQASLVDVSPVINGDLNSWGIKLNTITELTEEKLNEIISDLNFITGISNVWNLQVYNSYSNFPLNGTQYTIYYAIDTNKRYMWDTIYVDISTASSGVISVNGRGGSVTLSKSDVGLDNVNNTTDLNKPISTATQTALNNKQPLDSDLTALANLSTNGIITRVSEGNVSARTVVSSGNGISITNGNGVSGNPTVVSNATSLNSPSTIAFRDSNGGFSVGYIVNNGGMSESISTVTSDTTLTSSHNIILATGNITLTLPLANNSIYRQYKIKNIGTGVITINSSEKIDGNSNISISNQYDSVTIVCNGVYWYII